MEISSSAVRMLHVQVRAWHVVLCVQWERFQMSRDSWLIKAMSRDTVTVIHHYNVDIRVCVRARLALLPGHRKYSYVCVCVLFWTDHVVCECLCEFVCACVCCHVIYLTYHGFYYSAMSCDHVLLAIILKKCYFIFIIYQHSCKLFDVQNLP